MLQKYYFIMLLRHCNYIKMLYINGNKIFILISKTLTVCLVNFLCP